MKDILTKKEKEELLKLLDDDSIQETSNDDSDISTDTDEVLPFIYKYNLKSGDSAVNFEIIYKLYIDFASFSISKSQLKRRLNMFFDFVKRGSKYYIKLNTSDLKIAEEMYKQKNKKKVDVRSSIGKTKHFQLFMEDMDLTPGKNYIPGYLLHELYKMFCRNKKKVLSQVNFIKMASLYYPVKLVRGNIKWFGLEEGKLEKHLTGEQIEQIKEKRQRRLKRKRKKKIAKTQSTGRIEESKE